MSYKKFKIVIGADAKQFNDTMKGVKQDMRGVGTESVAMGLGVDRAIRSLSNAIQNFYFDAVAAAKTLPPGVDAGVDALKDLEDQMKVLDQALGLSFIGSATFWQTAQMSIKTFVIGAKSDLTSLGTVLQSFLGGGVGMAGTAQIISAGSSVVGDLAADINKVTVAAKEQADFGKMIAADFAKMAKDGQAELTRQGREAEKASQKRAEALKAEKKAFEESVAEMMRYNYELAKMDELNRQAAAAMEAKMVAFGSTMQAGGGPEKLAAFVSLLKDQNEQLAISQGLLDFIGTAFNDMFITALNSGQDFFQQMGLWLENFIKRMIAAAATAALLTAISGGGSAGFLGAFRGLIGLTKMAHGGIVDKPTNVQVGEAGPEAIIPLHKLSSLTGGGNLTARISGRDLLILLDREQSFKKRVYG